MDLLDLYGPSGPLWTNFYGLLWTFMNFYGLFWTFKDLDGPWTLMDLDGPLLTLMDLDEP
jgi:hypothetical protein